MVPLTVTLSLAKSIVYTVTLAIATYFVIKLFNDLIDRFAREGFGERYSRPIKHFSSSIILIAAFFILLYIWGVYDVLVGVVAGAGFAGIVVGFAAKDVLADILSGILIFFDHPFDIGDWIEVGDEGGILKDVSLRSIKLDSFSGESVIVPNRKVRSEVIRNMNKNSEYRIDLDIGVSYEDDVEKALDVLDDFLDSVNESFKHEVLIKEFSDSSIVLQARIWVKNPSKRKTLRIKTKAYRGMKKVLEDSGISIPYPHLKVLD